MPDDQKVERSLGWGFTNFPSGSPQLFLGVGLSEEASKSLWEGK